ncbi:S8 family peptidase [Leptospira bouyouniensis]|uniref:S8 family peptidase n=1 Tax=Leptospira bouyouniensis TaxID=2484911 RepID=A0ABY2KZB6_9LEPT|nr:S8 family peptidase [Leptospira bouyouniensis]TGK45937.1 S8 family peptidase [Leptospira bouyouniensis]
MVDFPHLPLPLVRMDRARLNGGGKKSEEQIFIEKNIQSHYDKIKRNLSQSQNAYFEYNKKRTEMGYPSFEAGVPLLIRVGEDEDLDFLRSAFNFEIVSQQDDGFVIVASEDIDFSELNLKLEKFKNSEYGGGTVGRLFEIIEDIDLDHRFQRIVDESIREKWVTIKNESSIIVDLSVECLGQFPKEPDPLKFEKNETESSIQKKEASYKNRLESYKKKLTEFYRVWDDKRDQRIAEIINLVSVHKGELITVLDDPGVKLPDSFVARVKISPEGLKDIIYTYPYLFQVSEPDEIQSVEVLEESGKEVDLKILEPDKRYPSVCVIDSGIQENHRLLHLAIQSDVSECFIPGVNASDIADYVINGGHGTRVAGMILYPNGVATDGEYKLPCFIQNARILDNNNGLKINISPLKYLEQIIEKYNGIYNTKIFNHSIASKRWAYRKFMSIWGTVLDQISHEKDVLFIQAAGNLTKDEILDSKKMNAYPDYLLKESHRIKNPAQALNVLTVGSITIGEFNDGFYKNHGSYGNPSSFTTTGYGIWNSIKPDVVDLGGDWAIKTDGSTAIITPELCLDIPRSTLHGGPDHDRDMIGTSLAAPRVSSLAVEILKILPDAPAQLLRALIVNSAIIPEQLTSWKKENIFRTVGYGIPVWDRALENSEHRVTLVSNDLKHIPAKQVHLYQIPIPAELRKSGMDDIYKITVTLAYTALPRRTRRTYRFYNSVWIDWVSSRKGETFKSFENRMVFDSEDDSKDGYDEFKWFIGEATNRGQLEGIRRQNGTLQKDWAEIPASDMPHDLCIAVRGHKGWNSDPEATAKYSLVVTIESVGKKIPIYQSISQSISILQKSRIKI